MEKTFSGKVALVTGASYGIGSATALALAARGAMVVLADWKEDPERTTEKQIKQAGGECRFIRCDVSDTPAVKNLVAEIEKSYGRLDIAFNNAGIEGEQGKVHECSEENWDRTIAVNLKGVWNSMRFEIPLMLKQQHAVIINCASVAGLKGFSGLPAYTASKHAVIGLTKSAALDYAGAGLRIAAICPGVIRTPMVERVVHGDAELDKAYSAMAPMGRMGKPSEIAETVAWLCSDGAAYVTGAAFVVDGGFLA